MATDLQAHNWVVVRNDLLHAKIMLATPSENYGRGYFVIFRGTVAQCREFLRMGDL